MALRKPLGIIQILARPALFTVSARRGPGILRQAQKGVDGLPTGGAGVALEDVTEILLTDSPRSRSRIRARRSTSSLRKSSR